MNEELLNIIVVVLAVLNGLIIPILVFLYRINSRLIKVEDDLTNSKKLNAVLFSKLDKFNDNLIEVGKELHHLVKLEEMKKINN